MAEQKENCTNCAGDCKTRIYMPCKVCTLVHNDPTPKLSYYCDLCKAYICCAKCKQDIMNRGYAAVLNIVEKVKEVFTGKQENEKAKTTNGRNRKHSKPDDVSGRV